MDRKLAILSTAALLHDIGKFYRRAENKHPSHQDMSFEAIQKVISPGLKRFFTDSEVKEIALLAKNHHYERDSKGHKRTEKFFPSTPLKALIDGDRHSAGLDRHTVNRNSEEKQATQKSPLVCIFEEIAYEKKKINTLSQLLSDEAFVYKFKKLSPENAFPVKKNRYCEMEIDYPNLWKEFVEEFNSIQETTNFNQFFEAMKTIIIRYTWCVPSNTYSKRGLSIPDIPLCDHLTSSAAIANASYRWRETFKNKSPEYILLSGDFSGIQNFIFLNRGESKKYAAKILRAKSLMVSLALEMIITEIVKEFELNRASLLLNAGGKFIAVLPDIKSQERINRIKRKLEENLIKKYYGILQINLAFVKLKPEDFEKGNFLKKMRKLSIEEAKQKFKTFHLDNTDKFAIKDYIKSLKGKEPCSICGVNPANSESNMCNFCIFLSKLGEKLPKSKILELILSKDNFPFPKVRVYQDGEIKEALSNYKTAGNDTFIFSIGESVTGIPSKNINVHLPVNEPSTQIPEWIKEEIVKKCSEEKDKLTGIKTFCQLGIESLIPDKDGLKGKPFIGVLKADVDNLGFIFAKGFAGIENSKIKENESLYSVSRVLYLSRMIDYFFSVVLTNKLSSKTKFKNIYIVFAGGDDLFLIGPWEDTINLVKEMEEDFREYVAFNPDVTFSSGIFISKSDVPVYFLAKGGEKELEHSKEIKNCISIFGKRANYQELKELLNISKELEREMANENVSTAFVYKLITLSNMANRIHENAKNAMWKPYLSYLVFRNYGIKNNKTAEEKEKFLDKWIKYIERYSENLTDKQKDNKLYIALAKALYRRRKYGTYRKTI